MMPQLMQRIGIPFVLLCLATLYFLEVRGGKAQDMMLIGPVYYLMVVLFVINAATDLRDILRERGKEAAANKEEDSLKRILSFGGLAILLVIILPWAGFLVSATLFVFATLMLFEVENKTLLYVMPIVVTLTLYALFEYAFGVELPTSVFGF